MHHVHWTLGGVMSACMRHYMRSGAAHRIDCMYTRPTWYAVLRHEYSAGCTMQLLQYTACTVFSFLRTLTTRHCSHAFTRTYTFMNWVSEWVSEWVTVHRLTDWLTVGWWTVWDARQWRVGVAVWQTDRHSHIELLTDWDCDHTQCCVSVKWWWMLDCCISLLFQMLPSVLWHWSLGVRKSIRPVKIEWWGVGVVICLERGADCLHMVQLMPLPSQTTSSLTWFKSRLVLLWFLHLLLQVVLEKRPLSGYTGSC